MSRIFIVHYYKSGSAASNRILAYTKGYAKLGLSVELVLGGNIDKTISIDGVRISFFQALTKFILPFKMTRYIQNMYKEGDLIHIYGLPLFCFLLKNKKYKTFIEFTEVPFYGMQHGILDELKESLKLWMAKMASGMIVISQALKDFYINCGIEDVAVINMFVDSSRFDTKQYTATEKYIAYCGKISNFKDGLDCLIKAFCIFHKNHHDYKLYIIGDFRYPEFEKVLKELISSLQLENSVVFTGSVHPDEMPNLLSGAEMLVLARPDNEQARYGFPTKLGEYLATGKPVVVTRVGEIGLFLRDGENCRMAEPDSPDDFAAKMTWVADHYPEALSLGKRGRELTLTEFSSLEQSKKALNFMNEIVR